MMKQTPGRLPLPILATAIALWSAGAASAQPQRYVIDPMHTFVTFEVLHFGTSTVRARFDR